MWHNEGTTFIGIAPIEKNLVSIHNGEIQKSYYKYALSVNDWDITFFTWVQTTHWAGLATLKRGLSLD